jgi:hypothetical protein
MNRLAAACSEGMKSSMLPLTSSAAMSSSGMSSEAKCETDWTTPSSKTRKSACVRPWMKRPSPSVTTADTCTTSTSTRSA